ncbi:substrate-binding domain-containing protein [Amycolatopsis sp. NPDC003865]
MKRPTITDIAREAGVSKGAVSYALNGRPGVSEATRHRITRIARELGWSPSSAARALSGGRSGTIGLVLDGPSEVFFPALLDGFSQELLLRVAEGRDAAVAVYHRWRAERKVDGVLLTGPDCAAEVARIGLPAVVLGGPGGLPEAPSVRVDDTAGAAEALEYLAALGHRHVVRIAGAAPFADAGERAEAFTTVAHRLGLSGARTAGAGDSPQRGDAWGQAGGGRRPGAGILGGAWGQVGGVSGSGSGYSGGAVGAGAADGVSGPGSGYAGGAAGSGQVGGVSGSGSGYRGGTVGAGRTDGVSGPGSGYSGGAVGPGQVGGVSGPGSGYAGGAVGPGQVGGVSGPGSGYPGGSAGPGQVGGVSGSAYPGGAASAGQAGVRFGGWADDPWRPGAWAAGSRVAAARHAEVRSASPAAPRPYTPPAEPSVETLRSVLAADPRPTALLCDTDALAVAALVAARELGLAVPRDLSVVSWDDSGLCRLVRPALSAVRRPLAELGGLAASMLRDLVAGEDVADVCASRPRLVTRGSTGPVR